MFSAKQTLDKQASTVSYGSNTAKGLLIQKGLQSVSTQPNLGAEDARRLAQETFFTLKIQGFSQPGVHGHVAFIRRLAVYGLDDAGDQSDLSALGTQNGSEITVG